MTIHNVNQNKKRKGAPALRSVKKKVLVVEELHGMLDAKIVLGPRNLRSQPDGELVACVFYSGSRLRDRGFGPGCRLLIHKKHFAPAVEFRGGV